VTRRLQDSERDRDIVIERKLKLATLAEEGAIAFSSTTMATTGARS
jgi:hypothetical protein